MNTLPIEEDYIQTQEKWWLEQFSPYLSKVNTLKIGNGFGHLSELIRPLTENLSVLDIVTYPNTINKKRVQIYDGRHIPYPDKYFESTIVIFTLHHIPKSSLFFKEIMRVTKKRIILLEETYDNLFQKTHLYYRDWIINKKAGQSCKLYWKSYFSRKQLVELVENNNLKKAYRLTKRHKTYFKELFILDRD